MKALYEYLFYFHEFLSNYHRHGGCNRCVRVTEIEAQQLQSFGARLCVFHRQVYTTTIRTVGGFAARQSTPRQARIKDATEREDIPTGIGPRHLDAGASDAILYGGGSFRRLCDSPTLDQTQNSASVDVFGYRDRVRFFRFRILAICFDSFGCVCKNRRRRISENIRSAVK